MAKKKETAPEAKKTAPVVETIEPAEQTAKDASPETISVSKEELLAAKEQFEKLQAERDENIALAQRLQADFENFRKRNNSIKKDSYDEGVRDCIRALLPTLDNFDRALDNAQGVDPAFADGVRLVFKTFYETLEKQGMQEIDAGGEFDPNFHNAVMQGTAEGKDSGEIIEVFQKGYRVGERVLRHSMVKVAE